jgi:hypothetical protein
VARKHGSYQKRTFLDTSLGRLIYLVEPQLFNFLCPELKEGFTPDINIISAICNKLDNPTFKTKRFYSYLSEYEEFGLRVKRKKKITPEIEKHYEKLRNRRLLKKISE